MIPLKPQQTVAFERLREALEDKTSLDSTLIDEIQSVSWEIVSVASEESWGMLYQVYFALTALRPDGTYAPASALSPHLAKFEYLIRIPCLMEALKKPASEATA